MNKKILNRQLGWLWALRYGILLVSGILLYMPVFAEESKTIDIRVTIPKIIEHERKSPTTPPEEEKNDGKNEEEKSNPAAFELPKIQLPQSPKTIVRTIVWEP